MSMSGERNRQLCRHRCLPAYFCKLRVKGWLASAESHPETSGLIKLYQPSGEQL